MFSVLAILYNEILHRPLLNALAVLVNIMPWHDAGLAIIVLTVLVRALLFPITHRSVKAQAKMKELEPYLAEVREKHKNNKEEQARRIMEIYKKHGVSPLSGCLAALLQLPVLIALYYLFWRGLGLTGEGLYSFVSRPPEVNMHFLGILDLGVPNVVLGVLAGFFQFLQMRLAQPPGAAQPAKDKSFQADLSRAMRLQTTYVLPIFIAFVAMRFPAAVSLYWTTTNIFAIVHESTVRRRAIKTQIQYGRNSNHTTQRNDKGDHIAADKQNGR